MAIPPRWELLNRIEDGRQGARAGLNSGLDDRYVGGTGPEHNANIQAMIIGEAPGGQEAIAGRPFVGPTGAVLEQLCAVGGLTWESMWLTNVVTFYPPWRENGRKPTDEEVAVFKIWLRREWVTVGRPTLVIPLGGTALYAVTGERSILKHAGTLMERTSRGGHQMSIWPMVHPSFGLRNPEARPLIESHWQKLEGWLASLV
jgi:uracil-DNA glycosylase